MVYTCEWIGVVYRRPASLRLSLSCSYTMSSVIVIQGCNVDRDGLNNYDLFFSCLRKNACKKVTQPTHLDAVVALIRGIISS